MPSLELPAQMSSIARARIFVREQAQGRVTDVDTVALMTSELVSNVVIHASGTLSVRVEPGPPFRVEVHDGLAATNAFRALIATAPPPTPVAAVGGRGIGVVHALASRVGLDDAERGGKVVWFEV